MEKSEPSSSAGDVKRPGRGGKQSGRSSKRPLQKDPGTQQFRPWVHPHFHSVLPGGVYQTTPRTAGLSAVTSLLPPGLVVCRSHLSQEDPDPPAWPESSSPNAKLIGWPHCAARRSSPHRRGPLDTDEALSTACKAGARACRPVHIPKQVGPRVPPGPPLRPPRVGEPRPVSHATARPWCDNDTVVTTIDTRVNVHLSLGS